MLSGGRGHLLATGIETTMLDDRLTSVRYRNFMSFADEEVELGDLVVLVGPNGAGKSNFIEGLRFLRDAITIGLDAAITNRGGIGQIRRKLPHGRRRDVKIGIEAVVDGSRFSYEVAISASARGDWRLGERDMSYRVRHGRSWWLPAGRGGLLLHRSRRSRRSARQD